MIDKNAIFKIKTPAEFENLALEVFKFQFENNRCIVHFATYFTSIQQM
ncbi:hypothetical protein JCM19300_3430 [Algibacter lectus]|uniref:Uncharacterized protein n=1 Tax=Algibacter lectus TaxID=221126 RepID=A0A090W5R6_9FLAO|nr:hypothetical protein JCM19300_3430 [Algibacter lectus]